MKDLENPQNCPYKWRAMWIDRSFRRVPSERMLRGSYFEQQWLGAGATDEVVLDLPRLKNGDKSAVHNRIDAQVEKCKKMFEETSDTFLGFSIKQVQLKMASEDREGTADIWAIDKDGGSWLIDVKLTEDLTSTYSKYSWGRPYDELDLIQLPHYQSLFNHTYGHKPRMALFIVDYSPQMRIEFNEIVVSDDKMSEKEMRFESARNVLDVYLKDGFPKNPSKQECKDCGVLDCSLRIK